MVLSELFVHDLPCIVTGTNSQGNPGPAAALTSSSSMTGVKTVSSSSRAFFCKSACPLPQLLVLGGFAVLRPVCRRVGVLGSLHVVPLEFLPPAWTFDSDSPLPSENKLTKLCCSTCNDAKGSSEET